MAIVDTHKNTQTVEKEEVVVQLPKKYKVVLHNDNTTTFEFVIYLLTNVFHKTMEQSVSLTQQIHDTGSGIAGIYTKEIAEEKVTETMHLAKSNSFPLVATYEEY